MYVREYNIDIIIVCIKNLGGGVKMHKLHA